MGYSYVCETKRCHTFHCSDWLWCPVLQVCPAHFTKLKSNCQSRKWWSNISRDYVIKLPPSCLKSFQKHILKFTSLTVMICTSQSFLMLSWCLNIPECTGVYIWWRKAGNWQMQSKKILVSNFGYLQKRRKQRTSCAVWQFFETKKVLAQAKAYDTYPFYEFKKRKPLTRTINYSIFFTKHKQGCTFWLPQHLFQFT